MTPPRRYHQRQQKARQRRLAKARERLRREQARAQRHLQALEHAVQERGLPAGVAEDIPWRLQAQAKLLGKLFGLMFPPFLAAGATASGVGSVVGTSICPAGS